MFNFNDAEESKSQFLNPGIHTVKTTQITDGVASTGAPYLEWTLEDSTGATCVNRFYLNTTAKEGSTKSAWDITKPAIVNAIAAINNCSFDEAKTKLPAATTAAQLSFELAKITVNKPFDIRLSGKEIQGKDGKQNWIKSEFNFAKGSVAPANSKSLTYDPAKNTKYLTGTAPVTTSGISTNTAAPAW